MKKRKNFAEMKTFYNKCLAKDIKLSSFFGRQPKKKFHFKSLIYFDYFYELEVLVLILLENFIRKFNRLLNFS